MAPYRKEKFIKVCSIIGAHLVNAPYTFMMIYGNLSAYMDSYFHFACAPRCTDIDTSWFLSTAMIMVWPGAIVSKYFTDRMGLRLTGLVIVVINNAAVFASAWTVHLSVAWTTILFAGSMGFFQGVSSVLSFQALADWAPNYATLFISTTLAGPSLVGMVENQIITYVVNPENLKPSAIEGSRTYFSQPEILGRLPSAIIVYSAMTLGLQCLGYLMLSPPPTTPKRSHTENGKAIDHESSAHNNVEKDDRTDGIKLDSADGIKLDPVGGIKLDPVDSIKLDAVGGIKLDPVDSIKLDPVGGIKLDPSDCIKLDRADRIKLDRADCIKLDPSDCIKLDRADCIKLDRADSFKFDPSAANNCKNGLKRLHSHDVPNSLNPQSSANGPCDDGHEIISLKESAHPEQYEDQRISLTPSEALKKPNFYAVFSYGLASVYSVVLKSNFYKQFALLYIHNDTFLTTVGTLSLCLDIVVRIGFGFVLNRKYITTQDALVLCLSVNCVLCIFWYFVPQLSGWLYLVHQLAMTIVQTPYSLLLPVACLDYFGPAHFSTIFALALTCRFIMGVLSALIILPLLHALGWFWLFSTAAFLCAVSLVMVVCADLRPLQKPTVPLKK